MTIWSSRLPSPSCWPVSVPSCGEVRPGNRATVHHVIAFIREPGSKWNRDRRPGEVFVPEKNAKGEVTSVGLKTDPAVTDPDTLAIRALFPGTGTTL